MTTNVPTYTCDRTNGCLKDNETVQLDSCLANGTPCYEYDFYNYDKGSIKLAKIYDSNKELNPASLGSDNGEPTWFSSLSEAADKYKCDPHAVSTNCKLNTVFVLDSKNGSCNKFNYYTTNTDDPSKDNFNYYTKSSDCETKVTDPYCDPNYGCLSQGQPSTGCTSCHEGFEYNQVTNTCDSVYYAETSPPRSSIFPDLATCQQNIKSICNRDVGCSSDGGKTKSNDAKCNSTCKKKSGVYLYNSNTNTCSPVADYFSNNVSVSKDDPNYYMSEKSCKSKVVTNPSIGVWIFLSLIFIIFIVIVYITAKKK